MYMGVILLIVSSWPGQLGAPHVYGGDPREILEEEKQMKCSPCIWG